MEFAGITGIGSLLPAVICMGGCVLCMRMMSRGSTQESVSSGGGVVPNRDGNRDDEVIARGNARIVELETEVARLRAGQTDDRSSS